MKASEKCIAHIKRSEGCKLFAYRDMVGKPTIGYGSTKNVMMGMAITQAAAEARLLVDIHDVEEVLRNLQKQGKLPTLTQGQWDALVDFGFNLGASRLIKASDGKPTTLYNKIVAKAPAKEIQAQFRRWVYANGKVAKGLVTRREWEANRWVEKD